MSFRQSVSLPMFVTENCDPRDFVKSLAEIGFEGLEIWGREDDFLTWVGLAKEFRLTLCSMVGHRAAFNNRETQALAAAELRESIEVAAEHGIPGVICFGGNRIAGQTDAEALKIAASGLSGPAAYAEKMGVKLLLELLNSKVDHPGYVADHTSWGVALCREVESPNLRLLYDIYHMQIMEGDVIRTIRDQHEWIGHFHTAGNPGRHEIGRGQELNYTAIGQAIREVGYTGFVGHEFRPRGNREAALKEAFKIMVSEGDSV